MASFASRGYLCCSGCQTRTYQAATAPVTRSSPRTPPKVYAKDEIVLNEAHTMPWQDMQNHESDNANHEPVDNDDGSAIVGEDLTQPQAPAVMI